MLIVDSQVHIWAASTPERPWPARHAPHRPQPFSADDLLAEMNAAGVDAVIIVPPGWEGDRNDLGLEAARLHPTRFAVMGRLDPTAPESRSMISRWRNQPGMLGLRFTFHTPQMEPLLTEGHLDWLWSEAEKHGVPLMVLVPPRLLPVIAAVGQRHPGLKLTLDHLSVPRGKKDAEAFAHLDELAKLAALPNVAVKATSLPHYTTEAYPHRSVHTHLRKVIDAFGPKRVFWGTDMTKLAPGSYRQVVTMVTEEMPWLADEDKAWLMGRGICEWLGWQHPRL
ncbi:MAG TPA: amidohydrolase family protein [Burkholderiales bacterium]|nr:amidohydrolase family protein [Burkholderiales bacterium]